MFTNEEIECFSKVAESLKKYRRAELLDETGKSILDELYVDLLDGNVVLKKCLLDNTTFLVGRKGTGKSTIFLKLENEYRKKSGYLPCYIDVKTIFESAQAQSTYADYLADYMDRETLNKYLMTRSFIQSVLSVIYSEVDKQRKSFFQKVAGAIVGNSDEKIKEKIKILREKVDNNEEFKKIELPIFQHYKTKVETSKQDTQKGIVGANVSLGVGTNPEMKMGMSEESALENISENSFETEFSELFLKVFEIRSIISNLQEILGEMKIVHLVIMLDDISEIDGNALKLFMDSIVAPLNNWSNEFVKFKIAFYPTRVHYGKIDPGKIDIIDLDFYELYSEFDVNRMEENATNFTKRLIDNRFEYYGKHFSLYIDEKMTDEEAYALMFKTSMNVPRIMGYMFSYLHQSNIIYGKKISKQDIENASLKYYEEKIEAFFNASTYCLLSLEEKRDIAQLKKLKDAIVNKAKEIKTQISTGELSGKYVRKLPYSSHFHIIQEKDKYLSTLELNHFISKYEEMSNRDGKKVNVYCLNYGLARKNNIIWGKPRGTEFRKYYIERPFNYTNLILNELKEIQVIYCSNKENCSRKFREEEIPFLQFTHFKCPECGSDVIIEKVIDNEIELEFTEEKGLSKLYPEEMQIVIELSSRTSPVLARDIAEEVDMNSIRVGQLGRKLAKSGIIIRKKVGAIYEYSLSEKGRMYCS